MDDSDRKIAAEHMQRSLQDYGFNIDTQHVTQAIDKLLAGGKPTGSPEMFIERWLKEIEETKA